MSVIKRGFAVVTSKADGHLISRLAQVTDEMRVRVSDGEFDVHKA